MVDYGNPQQIRKSIFVFSNSHEMKQKKMTHFVTREKSTIPFFVLPYSHFSLYASSLFQKSEEYRSKMFLISWNVAGWSSSAAIIRNSYGSLQRFFDLTTADIICIQECKGSNSKLRANPVEIGAADLPPSKRKKVTLTEGESVTPVSPDDYTSNAIHGWESFWSFSADKHRGFNGVVTFVRKGLTHRCNNRPFGEPELDDEGRVVVTYHSSFVLVNVYVPNARRGLRSEYKKRFLNSIVAFMEKARRETGLPVIFVGDLNMTYRAEDSCWSLRRLHLGMLRELFLKATQLGNSTPLSKNHVQYTYNVVCNYLCHKLVTEFDASTWSIEEGNPSSVDTAVISVDGATTVKATELIKLSNRVKKGLHDLGIQPASLLYNGQLPPLIELEELLAVGFRSAFAADLTKGYPPDHNTSLYAVIRSVGLPPHGDDAVAFMNRLLHENNPSSLLDSDVSSQGEEKPTKMVDSFRICEKDAYCPNPYTCWDQSRNCRSTNEGTRIDYILVDECLAARVKPRHSSENNCGLDLPTGETRPDDFFSEMKGELYVHGLKRTTANGDYPPAAYDGSGMPDLRDVARLHCMRGLPSTGLVVTPPQLSDHIGVCVVMDVTLTPREGKVREDQPNCLYKPAASIMSFFQKSGSVRPRETQPVTSNAAPTKKEKPDSVVISVDSD
ncbi:DNA-(apurinic or apyrimidinic site) lyase [Angomonas deanei]|uniref:Endonuclease/Exonuclease/phosphatase family, putative n=1 Tax=Angomonas deanei TaxID=59799 RepID=A0A7G2C312_9TRYP|nr:DNA-(apurinic or apyrimidinic site) lyase [Angomonas deanei]CAD2213123.1 Endonuclease/Exonuclease/phosphatase family, putative [Angomonas deanei]|eukprot:EPY38682.1 DNA-(apurinic or apyrimidinic site) lyase [Angomonas deanei]